MKKFKKHDKVHVKWQFSVLAVIVSKFGELASYLQQLHNIAYMAK